MSSESTSAERVTDTVALLRPERPRRLPESLTAGPARQHSMPGHPRRPQDDRRGPIVLLHRGTSVARPPELAMVSLDLFRLGDVYLDLPYEDAKFRYEKATGKVFRRFYGQAEVEIPSNSGLYHEAISAGRQITKEEYWQD